MQMEDRIRKQYVKTSAFLFIVSLFLPAISGEHGSALGYTLLLLNFVGIPVILISIFQDGFKLFEFYPYAFANPLYLASLFLTLKRRSYELSNTFSILALISMVTFIFSSQVPMGNDFKSIDATPNIGFYLWLLSGGLLAYGNYYLKKISGNNESI